MQSANEITLHKAFLGGDNNQIAHLLLRNKPLKNAILKDGKNIIFLAFESNNLVLIEALYALYYDEKDFGESHYPTSINNILYTSIKDHAFNITLAVFHFYPEAIYYSFEEGSIFHVAIKYGNNELLDFMFEKFFNENFLSARYSMLEDAISFEDVQILQKLLQDKMFSRMMCHTPYFLTYISKTKNTEILKILFQCFCNPENIDVIYRFLSNNEDSVLNDNLKEELYKNGYNEVLNQLIKKAIENNGFNIFSALLYSKTIYSPYFYENGSLLHYCIEKNVIRFINLLITNENKTILHIRNNDGLLPFHYAIANSCSLEIIDLLLPPDYEDYFDIPITKQKNALHIAIDKKNVDLLYRCIEHKHLNHHLTELVKYPFFMDFAITKIVNRPRRKGIDFLLSVEYMYLTHHFKVLVHHLFYINGIIEKIRNDYLKIMQFLLACDEQQCKLPVERIRSLAGDTSLPKTIAHEIIDYCKTSYKVVSQRAYIENILDYINNHERKNQPHDVKNCSNLGMLFRIKNGPIGLFSRKEYHRNDTGSAMFEACEFYEEKMTNKAISPQMI